MKTVKDLTPFKNTLPYASEIFGVYLPLLGWKSKRIVQRFNDGFVRDRKGLLEALLRKFSGRYRAEFAQEGCAMEILDLDIGALTDSGVRGHSVLLDALRPDLPPFERYRPNLWDEFITADRLRLALRDAVRPHYISRYQELCRKAHQTPERHPEVISRLERDVRRQIDRESALAGALLYLRERGMAEQLKEIFYGSGTPWNVAEFLKLIEARDPFELIDPKSELDRVGLSPIGVVHLYRQYFFEFDSFLGPPTGHIWLSPGATVELIEISTRKQIVERTFESLFESIVKTEKSETTQDELSEAVKENNKSDLGLGVNVSANQKWSVSGLADGSASASASFDFKTTQEKGREQTHKRMRQQAEKLSTEIRRSYKSTFKTVTETTDTSSKRYLLANNTLELVNYELRRKMRQVGVQVQDIGSYLCWQTYVDDPGSQLGVAKLVHIANPPDTAAIVPPELVVPLKSFVQEVVLTIPFVGLDTDDNDQAYSNGSETEVAGMFDATEHIESNFPQEVMCELANHKLVHVDLDAAGADAKLSLVNGTIDHIAGTAKYRFTIHLDYVHFHERDSFPVKARLTWEPEQNLAEIEKVNRERQKDYTEKVRLAGEQAFVTAARERIKLASKIEPRSYEDLREEERVVVYRKLIQGMLMKGIAFPDDATRHVAAELINSIFDVNKMLYFVAPEWWRPRRHASTQNLGPGTITANDTVGWGGTSEAERDNYYITDESAPAKLGSSLGWLLQLDGDNLRNAFLNAPWVKAVIPIRPGRERAAINWLQQVEGMNGIGPGDMYSGSEPELAGKTMLEALEILADKVAAKHKLSNATSKIVDPDEPLNDDNTVTATPIDKVYEHGFYPLQGGFRVQPLADFEVYDQWVEVLPTDQVVAVPVRYDTKTGRQI